MTQLGNIAQREVAAPLNPEVIIFTRDEQLKKELAAKRFQSLNETMAVLLQAIKSYEHLRRKIADTEEYKQGVDPAKVDQKDILGVIHQYLDQIHWYNIQSGSLQQEAYWDSLEKKSKQDAEIIGLRASWASHAKLAHFAAKDIKQMWDILQGIEITIKKLKQQMPTYQLEPGLGGDFLNILLN
ncbi:MAG: hypothetical protein HWD59_07455 [Coxiellaceae bacterium]|nr:MAG: hypothetical protein HWD59_07455 [Coxiellaceae bacterium]